MSAPDNAAEADAAQVRAGVALTRRRPSRRTFLAVGAVLLVLACSAVSALTARLAVPETVVFDMKGTVDLFMQQSAAGELDEAKARLLTTRFDAALKGSLSDWQQSHHAVILVAPAVVSPARDITPDIRADIAQRMRVSP